VFPQGILTHLVERSGTGFGAGSFTFQPTTPDHLFAQSVIAQPIPLSEEVLSVPETTDADLSEKRPVSVWVGLPLGAVPGLLLAWQIYFPDGRMEAELFAFAALVVVAAGVGLATQRRTRWLGFGLLVGSTPAVAVIAFVILFMVACSLPGQTCFAF